MILYRQSMKEDKVNNVVIQLGSEIEWYCKYIREYER